MECFPKPCISSGPSEGKEVVQGSRTPTPASVTVDVLFAL